MAMPERSGYKVDGGWAAGADNINGTNVPQQLTVDTRTGTPLPTEYKASSFIEFITGFTSGTGDEFLAYIANGSNTPGGSSGGIGSENVYRYGFNGQENSSEVLTGSTTAEYWEYDSRIGRRWNIDPVPKTMVSPYVVLGNSPIMYEDPSGADWYQKGKNGPLEWYAGSEKKEGYTNKGATLNAWVKTSEGAVWTHFKADGSQESDLGNVTVVGKKKYDRVRAAWANHLKSFNHTKADEKQWAIDESNYRNGNFSELSSSQIAMYQRRDQADKDWRTMSLGAVAIMAAPLAVVGAVETGATYYAGQGLSWLGRGVMSEMSLIKYIPSGTSKYLQLFGMNVVLQYTFNGKGADYFDAAASAYNPILGLAGLMFDIKPNEGSYGFSKDPVLKQATSYSTSAIWLTLYLTMKSMPGGISPTSDYFIGIGDNITQKGVDKLSDEKKIK